MNIGIYDNTLRDGEQYPNLFFSVDEKKRIAIALNDIGVNLLNVGFPSVGKNENLAIKAIVKEIGNSKLTALARCKTEDIDNVIDCGVQIVSLFFPGSKILRDSKSVTYSDGEIDSIVMKHLEYSKTKNLKTIFAFEDMFRCPIDWIIERYEKYSHLVDYFGLVDTSGCAVPWSVSEYMKHLNLFNQPIILHFHNDFGLATANTLTGINCGATIAGCTITGIGERAGNASFEELILAITYALPNKKHSIKLSQIDEISQTIQSITKVYLDDLRPVVGKNAFRHESGIHIDSILRNKESYQIINNEIIQRNIEFVLGKHSGRKSILNFLQVNGLAQTDDEIQKVQHLISHLIEKNERNINDEILKHYGLSP